VGLAELSRHLGPGQPFYALQSVGLAGDQPPLTSIKAMSECYVAAVREVQPHGPYRLGGRCYGAVIALEMAHRLIDAGETVELLCMMNVSPYDFPGLVSIASRRRFRRRGRVAVVRALRRDALARSAWKRLPYLTRELGRGVARELRRLGRRAAVRFFIARHRPLPQRLRDINFLNLEAFAVHASRPYPGGAVLMLSGDDRSLYDIDPALDWKKLAGLGSDIHFVPGAGDAMFREPGVRELARLLRAKLATNRS
jgi:thioesterase domain-containing protein